MNGKALGYQSGGNPYTFCTSSGFRNRPPLALYFTQMAAVRADSPSCCSSDAVTVFGSKGKNLMDVDTFTGYPLGYRDLP
ncbi:MAG: hypothetical protein IPO07_27540 [Haliscomenobacter sp.]|nr:hypothetical protein [Haliscomenobacter sp.]MBK9492133.1 hypothetical protein [Haliscomenobacter sp.]